MMNAAYMGDVKKAAGPRDMLTVIYGLWLRKLYVVY